MNLTMPRFIYPRKRRQSNVLFLKSWRSFSTKKQAYRKAMNLLLGYFNADWGYVAIFEEDGFAANFTCEVMSSWVKIPKDDRNKLTCDTIPWIIDTVKAGHDIVLGDIAGLPAEADIDKSC